MRGAIRPRGTSQSAPARCTIARLSLSREAYSLPIGAILLFAALACIMYLTRNLDWSGLRSATATD
ncbi:inner membrane CreD family protein [uncultured Sphingomonas sp.]|uniref:inner membrane CreD family protein n=1 Tax=uncultured Sphingomonas sp. TaxID=158754 RepID=UPI002615EC4F|nr:inner membrane CreD family protein [uncultured Sphingomonas sp.]